MHSPPTIQTINMQAVILAAGKGLRMRPLTETTPKALIDINGKPLLQHLFEALPEEVTEIIVVVGHLQDQIIKHFGKMWNGKPVQYVEQHPLDGTGSALHRTQELLHDTFLVMNGDDLYDRGDLERLIAHPLGLLVLATKDRIPTSALQDANGHLEGLETDPPKDEVKMRVCGAYVLDERFFKFPLSRITVHGEVEYSLPHTLIAMTQDFPIRVEQATWWQPVGTPEELEAARRKH